MVTHLTLRVFTTSAPPRYMCTCTSSHRRGVYPGYGECGAGYGGVKFLLRVCTGNGGNDGYGGSLPSCNLL